MKQIYRVEKSACTQVQWFMDQHPAQLAGVNATDARKALDQAVAGLTAGEMEQTLHRQASQESRVDKDAARETLLRHQVRALVAAARLKASEEKKLAGLKAPAENVATAKLVAAATRLESKATRHAAVLLPVLGKGFLEKLRTSIATVERALEQGKESRARQEVSSRDLDRWMTIGRLALKVLHPMVSEALAREPKLLDEWNTRRRKVGLPRPAAAESVVEAPVEEGLTVLPVGQQVRAAA